MSKAIFENNHENLDASFINYSFRSNYMNNNIINNNYFLQTVKSIISSNSVKSFAVVCLVHLLLIITIFYQKNSNQTPILSFSVTSVENISATSLNSVSSAASTATKLEKNPDKNEERILDNGAFKQGSSKKNEVQPIETETKSANLQKYNSSQQNAVISPTTPASFSAAYLNNPSPSYPTISRKLEEQGTVLLNVFVNIDGNAQQVQLKRSSGFERLDQAAIETVRKWRFVAAQNASNKVSSWVQVPVTFILEK